MSGGIAYVLDENEDFLVRCNLSMVELENISDKKSQGVNTKIGDNDNDPNLYDLMHDMTDNDESRLKTLIEHHNHFTDSSRAHEILENWDIYLPKFVKVMPVDYRRALMEIQESISDEKTSNTGALAGE